MIVGEARGPEILDMFQAMSQGNDGSMGTLHARSTGDAFVQIMRYALKAPEHLTPEAVAEALAARSRAACGPMAPPHGLYLVGVDY